MTLAHGKMPRWLYELCWLITARTLLGWRAVLRYWPSWRA